MVNVSAEEMRVPAPPQNFKEQPVPVRTFETGATRTGDADRYDPEGFLSPLALERYCEYMQKHRFQADGSVRASDNWQKGMPLATYIKGMFRHFLHFWQRHRGWMVADPGASSNIEEDLCAMLFNVQGYLHELIKKRQQNVVMVLAKEALQRNPLEAQQPSERALPGAAIIAAANGIRKPPEPTGPDGGDSFPR